MQLSWNNPNHNFHPETCWYTPFQVWPLTAREIIACFLHSHSFYNTSVNLLYFFATFEENQFTKLFGIKSAKISYWFSLGIWNFHYLLFVVVKAIVPKWRCNMPDLSLKFCHLLIVHKVICVLITRTWDIGKSPYCPQTRITSLC